MLEQDEQVVGDDADAEEGGIGGELSAGDTFHAEADLQFLDAILGSFPALAIPNQGRFGRFDTVADDDMALCCFVEQFGLALVLDDDQAERLLRLAHAMHFFGNGAVGVRLPGGLGNPGNGLLRRRIQSPPKICYTRCACSNSAYARRKISGQSAVVG
ncbi:MAG TPA: hypothetical protein PLL14_08300 [Accumulibacter sp.]|nr:hypothetical protein [Accumulibacter sp.]